MRWRWSPSIFTPGSLLSIQSSAPRIFANPARTLSDGTCVVIVLQISHTLIGRNAHGRRADLNEEGEKIEQHQGKFCSRTEERRVGNKWGSTCRYRGSTNH